MRKTIHDVDDRALRALRTISDSAACGAALEWLEEELAGVRRDIRATFEPLALSRLVGEEKTLSELLEAIGGAPKEAARRANADSASESAPSQTDWPVGLG